MRALIDDRTDFSLSWTLEEAMGRSSHALIDDGRVWLVDPVDWPPALERIAALGEPAGVLQLLDRHNRDARAIAARLDIPHLVGRAPAGAPFAVLPLIQRRRWRESFVWWARHRTLVVAEAIGTGPFFGLGRAAGVHPMLRLLPPADLRAYAPDHLLVGHGPPLHEGAATALATALDRSRSDIPRLLRQLPGMVRVARRS